VHAVLASGGPSVLWIGVYVLLGLAAILAAFVVTWLVVATVILGIARAVRGPSDPDLDQPPLDPQA
jgi:hypothetical protein